MLVSGVMLLVLAPLFIVIAIVIRLDLDGPVFYRGQRAAKDSGVFYIFKFRSMVVDAEQKGGYSTAIDDHRFTKVGRFIRRFKIDELPQFINVLIGDMSLVGPRPQVTYYTDQYTEDEKLILTVRPGITDLASIYFIDMDSTLGSGDVDEKYQTEIEPVKNKLRLQYVTQMSFVLDMKIFASTFFRLLGIANFPRIKFDL